MFTLDQQRAALVASHEKWLRDQGVTIDTDYCHSRNITGEPSDRNRTYRASDDCWKRGLRGKTVGTVTTDGIATVRVYKDNVETIVPANSFRKQHVATKTRKHNESRRVEAECARLAPIGNIE